MSRPTTPHADKSLLNQGRSRGRGGRNQRSSNGSRGQHSHRPPRARSKTQEATVPNNQVYDWFHQELTTLDPEETRSDSRLSSSIPQQNLGGSRGRSDDLGRNYSHNQSDLDKSVQSNQDTNKIPRFSKFHQLMKLSKLNGNDVVAEISDNSDFILLLNSEPKKDFLVLTIRTLAKLEQADFPRIVINILTDVCKSKFLDSLEQYLVTLPSESKTESTRSNQYYWKDVNRFWNNLLDLYKTIIELIPVNNSAKLLPYLEWTERYVIESIKYKADHNIDDEVQPRITKLYRRLKAKAEKHGKVAGNEMLQDFRVLNIVPRVEDLNDHFPYIRPCKIHGAYDSVDHYLDVQFRLLREDFICPLRTGIQEYKKLADTNERLIHTSDITIFRKVKIKGPTVVGDKIGVAIFFGIMPQMNWNYSQLFMYGSLLCLSKDNFRNVLFATVASQDSELLKKGELIIEPCLGTKITKDSYNIEYVMVESKVYFLPYYHTLNSLLYMSEENFPMKRYIVDAQSNPTLPKYLNPNTVYTYKRFNIPLLNKSCWPDASHLQFNESQYKAFQCALLQELSILHGPPGTGKTFVAIQIASALLKNSSHWYKPDCPTPMIVVCLTNHALDQFLEGILPYTDSLIRIGERSKNPNLIDYKLKAVRDSYFKDKTNRNRAYWRMNHYRRQLKTVLDKLGYKYLALRTLTDNTCIVAPHVLRLFCDDSKLCGLTSKDLLTMLFGVKQATLAIELNTISLDSCQSTEDDHFNSENENIEADDDMEITDTVITRKLEFHCLELTRLDAIIKKYEGELLMNHSDTDLRSKLKQIKYLRSELQARQQHHPLCGVPTQTRIWRNYDHWLTSSYEVLQEQIAKLETEYHEIFSQFNDFKQMTDLEVMRHSLVIGLTTTGAARLHESLRALRSPIVLVEEAAEILEAHVICSLTKYCQQVILIGDHKQLRPKPATYELEKSYNMGISLFERIVNMSDKCTQLVIQHRMRPEIAQLLTPTIYQTLENHTSVFTYPPVRGVEKSLFFLHHENKEVGSSGNQSMSNPFEVQFLLAFATYLIQQEYSPHEITILCTYSSQLLKFKAAKHKMSILRDVLITTVDNYQGEENRIILLSLVRNNEAGNIGFLKIENRVCVALSRAREGLYIMGNMNNLVMRNQIWPNIKTTLVANNAIGDFLILKCQIHTEQLTEIKCAADFRKISDGGCSRKCHAALDCGHTCQKPCHISDRDHKNYKCNKRCLKKCANKHRCKELCSVVCKPCQAIMTVKLGCAHTCSIPCHTNVATYQCTSEVSALLRCGHEVKKLCHQNTSECQCSHDCNKTLSCGHLCKKKCHVKDDPLHLKYACQENCTKTAIGCPQSHLCPKKCYESCGVCNTSILKDRSCGHRYSIQCSKNVENILCTRRCKLMLPCGHKCQSTCNSICGNCKEMVNKIVPGCGHEVKISCSQNPTLADCKSQCKQTLKCGHPCNAQCCEPCNKKCEYLRPSVETALCQHDFGVPCYKIEAGLAGYADTLLQHCTARCAAILPCGHTCRGTCGSCKQGRIHVLCCEPCNKILICGHKCGFLCKDSCGPCKNSCSLRCEHQECKNKCGVPCTPCQEPCSRQCVHFKCNKLCSEICDRESCDIPCTKPLKCGHPCIGFCGEQCPPLCRICNKEDLPKMIPDNKRSDTRFVYLSECGHTIENNYLDWIWKSSSKIGIKVCPLCQTRITYCKRYTNLMKQEHKHVEIVQAEISRRIQILRVDQQKIFNDIKLIEQDYTLHFPGVTVHKKLFANLKNLVNRKSITVKLLKDMASKLTVMGMILQKLQEISTIDRKVNSWPVVLNQMMMLITSLPSDQNVPDQMIKDIENELRRLHYMVQLCKLERHVGFDDRKNALQIEIIYLGLLNLRRFTSSNGTAIHRQIFELKNSLKSSDALIEVKELKVNVVELGYGDWFKCSNGHIYSIQCNQCPSAPIQPNQNT